MLGNVRNLNLGIVTLTERFEFHGELFETRSKVLEILSEHGFTWLSEFGAVDVAHDICGIEVTAIREEIDAKTIEQVLQSRLPEWSYSRTYYEDESHGELGWKVIISQRPENFVDEALSECIMQEKRSESVLWRTLIWIGSVLGRFRLL